MAHAPPACGLRMRSVSRNVLVLWCALLGAMPEARASSVQELAEPPVALEPVREVPPTSRLEIAGPGRRFSGHALQPGSSREYRVRGPGTLRVLVFQEQSLAVPRSGEASLLVLLDGTGRKFAFPVRPSEDLVFTGRNRPITVPSEPGSLSIRLDSRLRRLELRLPLDEPPVVVAFENTVPWNDEVSGDEAFAVLEELDLAPLAREESRAGERSATAPRAPPVIAPPAGRSAPEAAPPAQVAAALVAPAAPSRAHSTTTSSGRTEVIPRFGLARARGALQGGDLFLVEYSRRLDGEGAPSPLRFSLTTGFAPIAGAWRALDPERGVGRFFQQTRAVPVELGLVLVPPRGILAPYAGLALSAAAAQTTLQRFSLEAEQDTGISLGATASLGVRARLGAWVLLAEVRHTESLLVARFGGGGGEDLLSATALAGGIGLAF